MKTRFFFRGDTLLPRTGSRLTRRVRGRPWPRLCAGGRPWLVLALLLILARSPVSYAQVLSTNRGLAPIQLSSSFDDQPVSVAPAALSAPLPLDLSQISNAGLVVQGLQMDANAQQALANNGFVVVAAGPQTDMVGAYASLAQKWIPNFITSDSVLHLYHEQFDEVLKAVEANGFLPQIKEMSETLLA